MGRPLAWKTGIRVPEKNAGQNVPFRFCRGACCRMALMLRLDSRSAKAQDPELVAGALGVLLWQQLNTHLAFAQMALIVSSWLKPSGVAGLRVLAQYHHWLPRGACRVRLPGISSQPSGSCSRNQFHA